MNKPTRTVLAASIVFALGIGTRYIFNSENFRSRLSVALENIRHFEPSWAAYESNFLEFNPMLPLLLMGVALFVATVFLLLFSVRFRKIKVFISYKSNHNFSPPQMQWTDYPQQVAEEMKSNFEKTGEIEPLMLGFDAAADHDSIIATAGKMIADADAVVVVPDPFSPSFVDAEIMASYVAKKPLAIVKLTENQRLSNTALSGYPILNLPEIRAHRYDSLQNYLLFLTNHRKDFFCRLRRNLTKNFYKKEEFQDGLLGGVFAGIVALLLFWLFMPGYEVRPGESFAQIFWNRLGVIFFILLIYFSFVKIFIFDRIKISKIARQQTITRQSPKAAFEKMFQESELELASDQQILQMLDNNLLNIKH